MLVHNVLHQGFDILLFDEIDQLQHTYMHSIVYIRFRVLGMII